jgi:hypothetical protein
MLAVFSLKKPVAATVFSAFARFLKFLNPLPFFLYLTINRESGVNFLKFYRRRRRICGSNARPLRTATKKAVCFRKQTALMNDALTYAY